MPCVEPVTSATFPGSLMTASSSTRAARDKIAGIVGSSMGKAGRNAPLEELTAFCG
jgi:hypothetical protein